MLGITQIRVTPWLLWLGNIRRCLILGTHREANTVM